MEEEMPQDLQDAITKAYAELGAKMGEKDPYVAVRSSATAEDLPDASFAGQQDTYLNVHGAGMVIRKVKECYASCFTDRAVYYREKQGFDHLDVALSAVIQMMVYSKAAGVMFTVNVANGEDKNVLIEGAYGLGEYVVQGTVTPDDYLVDKQTLAIVDKTVNPQEVKLIRKPGGDVEEVRVPAEEGREQKLTDAQIVELAGYAVQIENTTAAIWIWNGASTNETARSGFSRPVRKPSGPAAKQRMPRRKGRELCPPRRRKSLSKAPRPARASYRAKPTSFWIRPASTNSSRGKSLLRK